MVEQAYDKTTLEYVERPLVPKPLLQEIPRCTECTKRQDRHEGSDHSSITSGVAFTKEPAKNTNGHVAAFTITRSLHRPSTRIPHDNSSPLSVGKRYVYKTCLVSENTFSLLKHKTYKTS